MNPLQYAFAKNPKETLIAFGIVAVLAILASLFDTSIPSVIGHIIGGAIVALLAAAISKRLVGTLFLLLLVNWAAHAWEWGGFIVYVVNLWLIGFSLMADSKKHKELENFEDLTEVDFIGGSFLFSIIALVVIGIAHYFRFDIYEHRVSWFSYFFVITSFFVLFCFSQVKFKYQSIRYKFLGVASSGTLSLWISEVFHGHMNFHKTFRVNWSLSEVYLPSIGAIFQFAVLSVLLYLTILGLIKLRNRIPTLKNFLKFNGVLLLNFALLIFISAEYLPKRLAGGILLLLAGIFVLSLLFSLVKNIKYRLKQ
ncbi:hypothetical protein D210916BOD24_23360 [Alteromonas sp. D210916BOD_24]|uniref:hypothetical protein n=1 Tax=Alteromonas sp. D210916BOD_24 TaxID=3157618 RepID=UPI00399C7845